MDLNGKTRLSDSVARNITSLIIGGQYKQGAKIPNETELSEKLNVSRSTIREAVKTLASQNVLEIRRGCGTFVCDNPGIAEDPLGFRFINDKVKLAFDLLEIRLVLEPHIAQKAAERAVDEEIKQISAQCAEVEKLILSGSRYEEEDVLFHIKIAQAAKNVVIPNLIPVINSTIFILMEITNTALREETILTHRAIAKAIENHDGEAARNAMIEHIMHNQRFVEKLKGS
ncbi:MAG: FadR family transcriptional regulator [Spirochaetaceae bacterium]|jgi:DNA-binding FadR family transcriptional regulator|nr:FadR family transcriptional regulator [Spirochaetaceae bacterium]